jgi:hypothetical protein
MQTPQRELPHSWFRSRAGRRFGYEFASIVVVKFVLLIAIYYLCFAPYPRPDTTPAAIERHMLSATPEPSHDR